MSNASPLVSIITPYFNAPDFFKEALQSLQRQSYQNFEIIVVDDASPDPPAEAILAEFAFSRLKLIRHQSNAGPQRARNTAVANSSGDYILSFDCDDILSPDYLTETVRALEDDRFAGAYTQIVFFGEKEQTWIPQPTLLGVMTGSNSGPNTFLYRREVYDAVGGYNNRVYCSDASLWLSALAQGFEFTLVDKPLMHYRVRSEGRLARLTKHEHVPQLASEFHDVYAKHLVDILKFEEERYFSLLHGFHALSAANDDMQAKMETLNRKLEYLQGTVSPLEQKSKSHGLRVPGFIEFLKRHNFLN